MKKPIYETHRVPIYNFNVCLHITSSFDTDFIKGLEEQYELNLTENDIDTDAFVFHNPEHNWVGVAFKPIEHKLDAGSFAHELYHLMRVVNSVYNLEPPGLLPAGGTEAMAYLHGYVANWLTETLNKHGVEVRAGVSEGRFAKTNDDMGGQRRKESDNERANTDRV